MLIAASLAASTLPAHAAATGDVLVASSLADLTLEQLGSIEVTSVSGRPESLQDAATSVYVITGEAIRRSSATSLPEALRLAPNLQVAQLNARQWAISARGFNNAIGNKLLVLVDGRIVYSPLFSGVFWDQNDVVLEDIERIEVISGPGGTLWGANAVNGVINVITKTAGDTQGALASTARSGRGGYEVSRWGGSFGDTGHYRVYGLAIDENNTKLASGHERLDATSKKQVGFRSDWTGAAGSFTAQGDAYEGGSFPANNLAPVMSGSNLLGRWNGTFANGSPFKLQGYLDYADRNDVNLFRDRARIADVEFSHEPRMPADRPLLWGAGYREDQSTNLPSTVDAFLPADRTLHWTNLYAQQEFRDGPWTTTLGAKAERNDYTGWEFLPNVRVAYKHASGALTWAALSRAVRAPSRLDRDFFVPSHSPFLIAGGPNFDSEVANVLEAGHRGDAGGKVTYSVTGFVQQYDKLRTGSTGLPAQIINQLQGAISGLEAWANWQAAPGWRLGAGLLELREHLHSTSSTPDPTGVANLGDDPREQWSLRSSLDIGPRGEFDATLRHVGTLPAPLVPAYTVVDLRYAWRVSARLELAVLGENLFAPSHAEFNAPPTASQIGPRVFLKATWKL